MPNTKPCLVTAAIEQGTTSFVHWIVDVQATVVAGVENGEQKLERMLEPVSNNWAGETEARRTDLNILSRTFGDCFRKWAV